MFVLVFSNVTGPHSATDLKGIVLPFEDVVPHLGLVSSNLGAHFSSAIKSYLASWELWANVMILEFED